MSAIFHWDIEQNSEAWFRARLAIPTASEMKRIITPTGKKSTQAEGYMNRLLFEYVSGVPFQTDEYQSAYMEHGHEYEAAAVKSFELMTGRKTKKVGIITNWEGMVGASPDRLVIDGETVIGSLEIKAPQGPGMIGYLRDKDSLVDEYLVQLQAQLSIGELDKSDICADNPKLPAVILEVGRDEKFISTMSLYLREFVDTMLEKRLRLDKEFGLKPQVKTKAPLAYDDPGEFGVSMADVDAIFGSSANA